MTKNPILYLGHILESITAIETQLHRITKDQFDQSVMMQGLVERKLEIIGEATKNIPEDFKELYPDIPWKDMSGMRDVLIHQYTTLDSDIVWKTAKQRTHPLKKHIEKMLHHENGE